MQRIVLMIYGSHLYGTATEYSDHDYKGIFLPTAHDILLQRVQPVIITQRKKKVARKIQLLMLIMNYIALQNFFLFCAKGKW